MHVYRVRHKETGQFWSDKGKSVWMSEHGAKEAYCLKYARNNYQRIEFKDQSVFEIVKYRCKEVQ